MDSKDTKDGKAPLSGKDMIASKAVQASLSTLYGQDWQ